ncbi:AraC family transcriptional activator of pobA [Parabacteroides sp. PM5-20]|uniref:AraC family transcriptional regulator n=1 Tax=unclassified Parabacteroides TaxID=2649774 RepID=UPI0013D4234F|nr:MULTISPECIES: helix-turn-helix domain-containing protein [unclassified Parabacteroides]MDH6534991.1 AraC family transcriptional activator of pobA [Parabacteroides sp. PM5-20]
MVKQTKTTAIESISFEEESKLFDSFMIEGGEMDILGLGSIPKLINAAALNIILQGEAEIALDGRSYRIGKGNLSVIFPHTVVQVFRKSEDFQGFTLGGATRFLHNINIPSSTSYYLYIKENPCISLNEEEQNTLLSLCDMLKEKSAREKHLFRQEISEQLLSVLCYEIIEIYQKNKPIARQHYSRKNRLFFKFQQLLATHYQTHRDVEYYADNLCITPRYLSAVTKEIAGLTAAEAIIRVVILNARLLLTSTNLTIQQVSDKLNFPNPSFFSQYFKKNVGMPPKEYRDQYKS